MTWSTWILLVLAIAAGELLGLELSALCRLLSTRLRAYSAKRRLRRDLPAIEARSYAHRELEREKVLGLLQRDGRSATEIDDYMKQWDANTGGVLQASLEHLRHQAGLTEAEGRNR